MFDVVIAGARVAGASTALLLARAGLRVLVVDPAPQGRDTLSTHALMRGGVLQLHRWGILEQLIAAGTPVIDATTFHYGSERIRVPLEPKDGIDGLVAPRRFLLDELLSDAAALAGAHVLRGWSLADLTRESSGQVVGARLRGPEGRSMDVPAALVIGADGRNSRVARIVEARTLVEERAATASIYGYWPDLADDGYHWHYGDGAAAGLIPTNDGMTCVFASVKPERLRSVGGGGLTELFDGSIDVVSGELGERLRSTAIEPRLRGFAGAPTVLRQAHGAGWALVGDAGYFKDPLTAHGITDALRDAELLARAVTDGLGGGRLDRTLAEYQATRDRLSAEMIDVTARIASMEWSLSEVKELHRALSRAMRGEVELIRGWARAEPAEGHPLAQAVA
ncbi:MAG: NAD(P)/FAD-dependent oxidoreductase [Gemmatimonadota bacterium]